MQTMEVGQYTVKKASGDVVPFDEEKLRKSLESTGASGEIIDKVFSEVISQLYDGISTRKIYQKAFAILRKVTGSFASKYKLKKAIMDLGPSGYPFEKFVAELLKNQGFYTEVDTIVEGKCISHEIDVIASKEDYRYMIECKFHRDQGRKSDVKTALYIQSRFIDVRSTWKKEHKGMKYQGWIVTNTHFTEDAYTYGKCVGLNLVSWDRPQRGSLKDRINLSGLHPITCVTSLKKAEIEILLDKGIILCKQLRTHAEAMRKIHISDSRIKHILKEASDICKIT